MLICGTNDNSPANDANLSLTMDKLHLSSAFTVSVANVIRSIMSDGLYPVVLPPPNQPCTPSANAARRERATERLHLSNALVVSLASVILIFVGACAFGLGILSLVITLLIIYSRGNVPSLFGMFLFGIFLFTCFWICAIGTNIHPKGRAWLNEGKEPKEKKKPKMMW